MKLNKIKLKDLPVSAFFRFEKLNSKELSPDVFQKTNNDECGNCIWVLDNSYKGTHYTKVPYGGACSLNPETTTIVRVYPNRFTFREK